VDYPASLEKRKIYVALSDAAAEKQGCCAWSRSPEKTTSIPKRCSGRSRCRIRSRRPYWPRAQCNLALFHQDGRGGLAKNDTEAASLLKLAADKGHAKAQAVLTDLNKRGAQVRT